MLSLGVMERAPIEIEYTLDGTTRRALFLRGGLGGAMVQGPTPPVGELLRFSVRGGTYAPGRLRGLARVLRAAVGGGDVFGLKLLRLQCGEGLPPVKEFLREQLHTELSDLPSERTVRIANHWTVICAPEDLDAAPRRNTPITAEQLEAYFHPPGGRTILNVYIRRTVAYLVNLVPFYGRAVRLSETTLVIHTNMPLPSLGAHVHVQLPARVGDDETYVVLTGAVQRRSDQRDQSVWKGSFEMRVDSAEEIEVEGIFFRFLDHLREETSSAD